MQDFERQGGIAFLILAFTDEDRFFYLPYTQLAVFWNRAQTGHEKHFSIEELDPEWEIRCSGYFLHYLDSIQKDLLSRPETD